MTLFRTALTAFILTLSTVSPSQAQQGACWDLVDCHNGLCMTSYEPARFSDTGNLICMPGVSLGLVWVEVPNSTPRKWCLEGLYGDMKFGYYTMCRTTTRIRVDIYTAIYTLPTMPQFCWTEGSPPPDTLGHIAMNQPRTPAPTKPEPLPPLTPGGIGGNCSGDAIGGPNGGPLTDPEGNPVWVSGRWAALLYLGPNYAHHPCSLDDNPPDGTVVIIVDAKQENGEWIDPSSPGAKEKGVDLVHATTSNGNTRYRDKSGIYELEPNRKGTGANETPPSVEEVHITGPAHGYVPDPNGQPGVYVKPGTNCYRVVRCIEYILVN